MQLFSRISSILLITIIAMNKIDRTLTLNHEQIEIFEMLFYSTTNPKIKGNSKNYNCS